MRILLPVHLTKRALRLATLADMQLELDGGSSCVHDGVAAATMDCAQAGVAA